MKISLKWLQDYIDLDDLQISQIAELLTDIGLEIEGVEHYESIKGGLTGLVVGEVVSCKKHENADRLSVCEVNIGDAENLQIVCGAPNVAAEQKVVVAPVNTTIYPLNNEPFTIKKAKIRGVQSIGMICAEDEIGLGESHEGIMVLPNDTEVGQPVAKLFDNYVDTIFEIGLTPNRSDAQSHIGVARDLAAAIETQLHKQASIKWPSVSEFHVDYEGHKINVSVENTEACPRYAGVIISNLTIQPSPIWLQNRLKAVGVKPINNVVDVTNYINHEYGQPLHAFDYDTIDGQQIIVKNVEEGTSFVTLDGVERKLSNKDLMICDSKGGMCIAGVYGGLNTGVEQNTTTIFLESAYFDPRTIRRTELRHNLRTDAAVKFEKGVDPTKQVEVLKRAALLIQELAGGEITSSIIDIYPQPIERKEVELSFDRLNQLTGINFDPAEAVEILNALDFEVLNKTDAKVFLAVPQYRADVYREADVIEEVLRIYGFNNVPLKQQTSFGLSYKTNHEDNLRNRLSAMLSAKGFQEIITNSITQKKYYTQLQGFNHDEFVQPINSLNANLDLMRPDMLMTGLEVIAYNVNRNMQNARLYDFGKIYAKQHDRYIEKSKLAMYISGNTAENSWLQTPQPQTFFDVKQAVNEVLKKCGVNEWNQKETANSNLVYGLDYQIGDQIVATMGAVDAEALKLVKLEQEVFYAVVDFSFLLTQQNKSVRFQTISKFPAIQRDLALVIDEEVNYQSIEQVAKKYGGNHLSSMHLFDVYKSAEKIGKGKKSYAVGFEFRNEQKTLTNQEIDKQIKRLIKQFEKELGATIRS